MTEFLISLYAMVAMFVLFTMQRNQREQRPDPQMVTLVGWGLFSLSSTLAILFGAVALAFLLGLHMPVPAGFDTPIF
ncbi:hypothetical protein E5A73_03480 [Sphingomonas gei]|uniref:Uncharacterized protein n=1 Tax=Sphingomonas gei TaxID=1395960 RepID=A0A4S1XK15_9SPHN|nr:hypothetical protein [Sphingomonas gei]TGX56170.1 hypothetical protein E5A73_03480 [Sphingomonas gei]